MEEDRIKLSKNKNIITNGFFKDISNPLQTITKLDMSAMEIESINDKIVLPTALLELNLSHNKLLEVPAIILNLENLKNLDLSYNKVEYFDCVPSFCNTLERLNVSNNDFHSLPYWVWSNSPQNLIYLNISSNRNISKCFESGYFEDFLQYTTNILEIDLHNCNLRKYLDILYTCPRLKTVSLGREDINCFHSNSLLDLPFIGLEKCCDLQRLNLCNTRIYNISDNIDIFNNLVELNASGNEISGLPNQFCDLNNLEICILSYNRILYLPDAIYKLSKLRVLLLNDNELCMVPDELCKMSSLKVLDLYNNKLCEVPLTFYSIEEIDLAQNYAIEPDTEEYLHRKNKLRGSCSSRHDGSKPEQASPDSEYSQYSSTSEEEENYLEELPLPAEDDLSEDWDADEYWVPCHQRRTLPHHSRWYNFVKRKMQEGNFCPMDAHLIPIVEQIRCNNLKNPQVIYESDGQFDDYSSDES